MSRWCLLFGLVAAPALAGELEGVKMADDVVVEGRALKLNGMGLRRKFIVDVYVAGLYVEHPSRDAAAILAADEARRVELRMSRDLDPATIVEAVRVGFDKNSK
ncbi:MAG: chalcone isomerase family protein, partial [Myxococcaceae bacterium]|nr:chalcone isomerase family protein [Myxococcaceae bacterium]